MQRIIIRFAGIILTVILCGCAHLEFSDGGLTYYDGKPYLFVSTTKDCISTATVVMVPDQKKMVKFIPGYGTADLSIGLNNGMIISAGQKTDTQIPQTITAVTGMATTAASILKGTREEAPAAQKKNECNPSAKFFPIVNGVPSDKPSNTFEVTEPVN
jgi:hypothetical protein